MTIGSVSHWVALLEDPPAERVLQAVCDCASDLASIRDRTVILRGVIRRTRTLTGADMCYLSLNDLAVGETYIHVTDGVETEAYQNIRMPLGTGVLGAVAAGGTAVQTSDYLGHAEMNHLPDIDAIVKGEGVKAILGAPLRIGGRVVGALLIAHRTETTFSLATILALERMASQAAIALEQTRLVAEILRLQSMVGCEETLNARRHRELEEVLRFDERLLGALIASTGPKGVLDLLSQATDSPVGLYDPLGRLLAGDEVAACWDLHSGEVRAAIEASSTGGGAVTVKQDDSSLIVAASSGGEEHLGTLVMTSPGKPGHAVMLVRASVFVSAMLLLERTLSDAANREQFALIEDLVNARPGEQLGVRARMLAYGLNPSGATAVFVTSVPASERYLAVAVVREALGSTSSLVSLHGGHICAITATDSAEKLADRIVQVLTSRLIKPLVGYSVSLQGLAGLADAHEEAHRIIAAEKALGWSTGHADVVRLGLAGMILSGVEEGHVDAVIDRLVGALRSYDETNDSRLMETAWVYLENGSRLGPTADQLHVHPNTVRQRAERIDRILGSEWRLAMTSVDVHFALRLWRLRQQA
jgi:GAF domain-containing protein